MSVRARNERLSFERSGCSTPFQEDSPAWSVGQLINSLLDLLARCHDWRELSIAQLPPCEWEINPDQSPYFLRWKKSIVLTILILGLGLSYENNIFRLAIHWFSNLSILFNNQFSTNLFAMNEESNACFGNASFRDELIDRKTYFILSS